MMNDLRQRYLADVVKQAELDAERFAATAPGKQPDAVFVLEAWGKAVYLIPVPSYVLVVLWPTYRDTLIAKAAERATSADKPAQTATQLDTTNDKESP